jgi:hypothetical protein
MKIFCGCDIHALACDLWASHRKIVYDAEQSKFLAKKLAEMWERFLRHAQIWLAIIGATYERTGLSSYLMQFIAMIGTIVF